MDKFYTIVDSKDEPTTMEILGNGLCARNISFEDCSMFPSIETAQKGLDHINTFYNEDQLLRPGVLFPLRVIEVEVLCKISELK